MGFLEPWLYDDDDDWQEEFQNLDLKILNHEGWPAQFNKPVHLKVGGQVFNLYGDPANSILKHNCLRGYSTKHNSKLMRQPKGLFVTDCYGYLQVEPSNQDYFTGLKEGHINVNLLTLRRLRG